MSETAITVLGEEMLAYADAQEDPAVAAEIRSAMARAHRYARSAKAEGTKRVYRSAWRQYAGWCSRLGFDPLSGDPDIVRLYIASAAETRAASTLDVHLSAIAQAHRLAGRTLDTKDPRIAHVMEGLRRSQARRDKRQATPITPEGLRSMIAAQPDSDLGLRNRAILAVGFGGALRRSEIADLDLEDVEWVDQRGIVLHIRRSKGDQEGEGAAVAIVYAGDADICAVRHLARWIERRAQQIAGDCDAAGRQPLFTRFAKGDRAKPGRIGGGLINRLIKETAEGIGLNDAALAHAYAPAIGQGAGHSRFSSHSLRAGLLTAAAEKGVALHDIMRHSRHQDVETARGYMRSAEIWLNNPSAAVLRPSR